MERVPDGEEPGPAAQVVGGSGLHILVILGATDSDTSVPSSSCLSYVDSLAWMLPLNIPFSDCLKYRLMRSCSRPVTSFLELTLGPALP